MENNIRVFLAVLPWVVAAILAGLLGCLALYKGEYRSFFTSSLFVKTVMWLPLYIVVSIAGSSIVAATVFSLVLAAEGVREWKRFAKAALAPYFICFLIGCAAISAALYVLGPRLWITVVMTSVLSDVAAFFFGKTIGRHHLPNFLNNRKTVEGVVGQVVGGIIGIAITSVLYGVHISWWAGACIGICSAVGDLANSFVKRKLEINDWGKSIPGHGGVLDRFSSLIAAVIGTTAIAWLL